MSLRDDFVEALKSVKRDFFKDYEGAEAKPESSGAEPEFSQVFASHESEPVLGQTPASIPASGSEERRLNGSDAFGDAETSMPMGSNRGGAWAADVHTDEMDDENEDNLPPDVELTPYKTVMDFDDEGSGGDGDNGDGPSQDGRVVFDDYGGSNYSDDRTVISKNTVIRGALQTDDSVRMFGQILGDIDCKSNILVAGKIRGNTSAANAYVIDAQVDGNLLCDDVVNITDDAWILGNIRAQQAEIDGKIKGNIEIRHTISIGSNSSVIGNISTDELEIKRGAFVNGQIMMYSPSRDVIDRFDQFEK